MCLIALVGLSIGIFITSITRSRTQAMGLFGLIIVLQIIFSGTFVPVSKFDQFTQFISYSLPLTYSLDSMQSIFVRGFALGDVVADLTALILIFVVVLVLAMIGLKTVQKSGNNQ